MRTYKFYTPHLMTTIGQLGKRIGQGASVLNRALYDSKMQTTWKRHRYYLKPKYQRQNTLYMGIFKRKRVDFNARLKWALKTMNRCGADLAVVIQVITVLIYGTCNEKLAMTPSVDRS